MRLATDKRLDELDSDDEKLLPKDQYLKILLRAIHGQWDDLADLENIQKAVESFQDLLDETWNQCKRMNNMSDEEALTMGFVAMMIMNSRQDKNHPACPWTFETYMEMIMKIKPNVTVPEISGYWEKVIIWDADVLPEVMNYPDIDRNHPRVNRNNNG